MEYLNVFAPMGIPKGAKKTIAESDLKRIKVIADRIKEIRKEKGYTSYENLAFDKNLSRMLVYRIETGKKDFTFTNFLKIMDALDITLEDFFKDIKI